MTATLSEDFIIAPIDYPEEDGKPVAEGDIQRKYLLYTTDSLDRYFQDRPDVYVSGNLFIYYEEGNREAVVSPDTFVVFGVEKRDRRTFKTWQENNKTPDFVLEVTSKTTRSNDQGAKKGIYSFLGVSEYFQYDPTGDYLDPQLQALRLVEGNYLPIPATTLPDGSISIISEVTGLEWRVESGKLGLYKPNGEKLLTYEEETTARQVAEQTAQQAAEYAAQQAQQAAEQAQQAVEQVQQAQQAAEQAQQAVEQAQQTAQQAQQSQQAAEEKARRLADKLRELNIDPDSI